MNENLPTRNVVLHVYCGGYKNNQVDSFRVALEKVEDRLKWECSTIRFVTVIKYCDDIRTMKWSPDDFVDWLLSSDYHFVLTHVHQGLPHWSCDDVVAALFRLQTHPGFPNGIEISCPIFLQDKRKYIEGVWLSIILNVFYLKL
jgi:hypothetical protein